MALSASSSSIVSFIIVVLLSAIVLLFLIAEIFLEAAKLSVSYSISSYYLARAIRATSPPLLYLFIIYEMVTNSKSLARPSSPILLITIT